MMGRQKLGFFLNGNKIYVAIVIAYNKMLCSVQKGFNFRVLSSLIMQNNYLVTIFK
jgi:hypothetical protein